VILAAILYLVLCSLLTCWESARLDAEAADGGQLSETQGELDRDEQIRPEADRPQGQGRLNANNGRVIREDEEE
jgi:hypothetical protein